MAYEYEYVEKLPEDLICSICLKVLCQPNFMNCCEQQFCQRCLEKWWEKNRSCPHCRSTKFQNVLMQQKTRRVGELKVYCPNMKYGCQGILQKKECARHLSISNDEGCLYVQVRCPNRCSSKVFRGNLKNHTEKRCQRRQVRCVHCACEGEHQFIIGKHVSSCPSYPLPCPMACGATVLRKDLDIHKETCPLEIVPCPYSELGCEVRVCRKDLEKHVESSALQHMTVLAKSHLALKVEYADLKAENSALKEQLADVNSRLSAVGQLAQTVPQPAKTHYYDALPRQDPGLSEHFSKMYPLLVNTSVLILNEPLTLRLSETNQNSGYHYLEVDKYKLKLEWDSVTALMKNARGQMVKRLQAQIKLFLVNNEKACTALPSNLNYRVCMTGRSPVGTERKAIITRDMQRVRFPSFLQLLGQSYYLALGYLNKQIQVEIY